RRHQERGAAHRGSLGRRPGGRLLHLRRDRAHERHQRVPQPDLGRPGVQLSAPLGGGGHRPAASWATHQLAEFLVAISARDDEESALVGAVQYAAEALEAEVAAVLCDGEVIHSVGFPKGHTDVDALRAAAAGADHIEFPGLGRLQTYVVHVEDLEGTMVLARSGAEGFNEEEVALLRTMARTLSLTLRNLRTL